MKLLPLLHLSPVVEDEFLPESLCHLIVAEEGVAAAVGHHKNRHEPVHAGVAVHCFLEFVQLFVCWVLGKASERLMKEHEAEYQVGEATSRHYSAELGLRGPQGAENVV